MTRKDFELIAKVVKDAHAGWLDYDQLPLAFADALEGTNSAFDRDRFIKACQL